MSCLRNCGPAALLLACAAAGPAGEAAAEPKMTEVAPRLSLSAAMEPARGADVYRRGPAVAYGDGVYLLVWQDGYNGLGGKSDILGLRLDESGRPLDEKPIAICVDDAVQNSPAVAFCAGKFLVVWADFRNGNDYDLFATAVDLKGQVAERGGVPLSGGKGGQTGPSVASNGKDAFLVLWRDARGGDGFDLRGSRVPADKTEADNKDGVVIFPGGASAAVVWNGQNYFVSLGHTGVLVGNDGKPVGEAINLWSARETSAASAACAWGKSLSVYNTAASPSPWGWSGNGSIIGTSVTPDGQSPEFGMAKHGWYDLAKDQAERNVRNAIEAARWRNHPMWPMGMPGGFKGSHDGAWPSGRVAAAWNGRSLLVVWTSANFVDELRLANRDLCAKRVHDNWRTVDEPRIPLVAGPTDEINPALAAGAPGGAILAYEVARAEGGVAIEYRLIREAEDRTPPRVAWVAQESPARIRVGFDEPVDAAGAGAAANYAIEGLAVRSAAFASEGPALGREVVLETDEGQPGQIYVLKTKNVKDLSPAGNATAGEPAEFTWKPGRSQRSEFIEGWLVVGRFPDNWDEAWIDPRTVHPSPDDVVKARGADELKAALKKVVDDEAWAKDGWEANCGKLFGGDKTWKPGKMIYGAVLRISDSYGKSAMSGIYANTYVYSDRERDVRVRIDSNDGNRAWMNGEQINLNPAKSSRGFHDFTDEVPAKLKKGWNQLLVQVENRFGEWLMIAQIVDQKRQPIRDLAWQLENPFGDK